MRTQNYSLPLFFLHGIDNKFYFVFSYGGVKMISITNCCTSESVKRLLNIIYECEALRSGRSGLFGASSINPIVLDSKYPDLGRVVLGITKDSRTGKQS